MAVLSPATTARYFRTELKDQLGGLYETTIFRAFMSGDLNLQLIQALLVPIFWRRAPEDRTIYLKLGMACRLISELHIEWPQVNTIHVPQTEEEHRSRLDRERTFFSESFFSYTNSEVVELELTRQMLFVRIDARALRPRGPTNTFAAMDLWYSIILQLPPNGHLQLPTFPQVTLWADQNPHLDVPGDYFKAFVSG
jgi:hypothetical protein